MNEQMNMFEKTLDTGAVTEKRFGKQASKPTFAHCLFEQSGTFKNEFIKLGIPAADYDIQNEFGETDHVVDIFVEIENAYEDKPSIFDDMKPDDVIFAFFPCTRFEDQAMLLLRGENCGMKDWSTQKKLKYSMKIHEELDLFYQLISKLALICVNKGLKIVIENPYSAQHYLRQYWCIRPSLIDKDRTLNGDLFKKPTQYFFIGFEPHNNLVFESIQYVERKILKEARNISRSLIHPQYANRFIRQYVL